MHISKRKMINQLSIYLLLSAALAILCLNTTYIQADVCMPAIFSDHMVLQQGVMLPVWGTAGAGEKITVSIAGQSVATTAGNDGKWALKLQPLKPAGQALEMTINANNKLTIHDVLVGEVWVCSGQSNMVVSRRNMISKEVGQKGNIRFFKIRRTTAFQPQGDTNSKWVICTPEVGMDLFPSATGYHFALEISKAVNAPVGMIQAAWSGITVDPWIPLETLENSDNFSELAKSVKNNVGKIPAMQKKYLTQTLPQWQKEHDKWQSNKQDKKEPKKPAPPAPGYRSPTATYNAMINPVVPYAIKGAIWYQGESNAVKTKSCREYSELQKLLIKGWRDKWGQGDFPFIFVQLPAWTTDRPWQLLRQAQSETLATPVTAMAVTLDLNPTDNLHPPQKKGVGQRLALQARKIAYGEDIVASGPIYKSMKIETNKIRIYFSDTGSGICIGNPPPEYLIKGKTPEADGKIHGFEIAGKDGSYLTAEAMIEDNGVVVWNSEIQNPVSVRYAWAAYPKANLYNREGLPAAPFQTDFSWDHLKK